MKKYHLNWTGGSHSEEFPSETAAVSRAKKLSDALVLNVSLSLFSTADKNVTKALTIGTAKTARSTRFVHKED